MVRLGGSEELNQALLTSKVKTRSAGSVSSYGGGSSRGGYDRIR